jgi:hypothetical protein
VKAIAAPWDRLRFHEIIEESETDEDHPPELVQLKIR